MLLSMGTNDPTSAVRSCCSILISAHQAFNPSCPDILFYKSDTDGPQEPANRLSRDQMRSECQSPVTIWSFGNSGLLQKHNIRRDLIPIKFGNWRAYIKRCIASRPREEPFTKISRALCAAAPAKSHEAAAQEFTQ